MKRLAGWLRLWFTFESGVGRREYLLSGLALAVVKYAGDAFMVWNATGRLWRPIDYLSPVNTLLQSKLAMAPAELLPLLAAWSLPFLWVGISMSMRRSIERLVGHINGRFGEHDWTPVRYLNRTYSRRSVTGFCAISKVGGDA